MPSLEVYPKSAVLTEKQTQVFSATLDGKRTGVTWSIEPSAGSGSIDPSGTYRAPRWIFGSRKATVIATAKEGDATPGSATVELSSVAFWTTFLGAYLAIVAVVILVVLVLGWERLCPACDPLSIVPSVVTLSPGQAQQFRANAAVRWSPELDGTGIYRATKDAFESDGRITVTATTLAEPSTTASATIYLSNAGGLTLTPSSGVMAPNGRIELAAVVEGKLTAPDTDVVWMKPEAGAIEPADNNGTAVFVAPAEARARPITILARTRENPPRLAAASLIVTEAKAAKRSCDPSGGPAFRGILLLIFLMGGVGALIHGISSFATYAGNRELLPSWTWWYCLKPLLGALVALAVYLVFRAGLGSADYSLHTADCVKVAAFAVLIGLFAENASLKLKDIFETLFQPRDDPRRHKAGTVAPVAPEIISLEPAWLAVNGKVATLVINGRGFGSESQVKVAGVLRQPSQTPTASEIRVSLTPEDQATERQLTIQVVNIQAAGQSSSQVSLEVRKT